jgi:DNA-binding GntR family transcriptional regulator
MPLTPSALAPPMPVSLAGRLVERLGRAVVTGELAPGEALRETELAGQLGVSRTPVREALRRLAEIDLVRIDVGRGYTVTPIDPDRLDQVVDVVAELVGMAARLAMPYLDTHARRWASRTSGAAFTFSPVADVPAWLPTGPSFIDLVLSECGNDALVEAVDRYRPHLNRLQRMHPVPQDVLDDRAELVVAAVLSGDAERLGDVVRDQVVALGRDLVTAAR